MKKLITILLILFIVQTRLLSQSCTPNPASQNCEIGKGISTNPNNPVNPECTNLVNDFDWRLKYTPGGTVPVEYYYVYGPTPALNPRQVINPFNNPTDAAYHPYVTANHGSNYQPTDGWELLKVDFGALQNTSTSFLKIQT